MGEKKTANSRTNLLCSIKGGNVGITSEFGANMIGHTLSWDTFLVHLLLVPLLLILLAFFILLLLFQLLALLSTSLLAALAAALATDLAAALAAALAF